MNPILVEDSSSQYIPQHVEVLLLSLEESNGNHSSLTDRNDLIVVLLYVLMIETGYSPLNVEKLDMCHSDHGYNVNKLSSFCRMPSGWKNTQNSLYEMSFILGRFTQYPCRLLIIPTAGILIINLIVPNLGEEKKTYALVIKPSKYITNITSGFIPSKFCNLKDLSLKFKNNLAHAARSVILTKENILNASLLGVPDEVKLKIFKCVKVADLVNISLTCTDLCRVSEDQVLWRYFLARDFKFEDVLDLVAHPGASSVVIWKEEYKRRYKAKYGSGRYSGRRFSFEHVI